MVFNPRTNYSIRQAINDEIHRREAALSALFHLSSSKAMRAECSDDDIIEIRRLSEAICRNLALDHGSRDRLWGIEYDLAMAILDMDREYREKMSIVDGSRGAEDVWNAVWSNHRRVFRRLVRKLGVYFGCVACSFDIPIVLR